MAVQHGKEISYGWFWTTYLTVYGFFRLMLFFARSMYHYPIVSKNVTLKIFAEMKSEADKNSEQGKISFWRFLRQNFINQPTLILLANNEPTILAKINFLKVGQQAPIGRLVKLDGEETDLHNIFKQSCKNIHVLNFGSYSWPPFRYAVDRFVNLAKRFSDQVQFNTIYIQEAHASDGWIMPSVNRHLTVCLLQPKTLETRIQLAKEFVDRFEFDLPFFVDTFENDTMKAYNAQPERLYVVKDGKIAYEGGPGPACYSVDEVEQCLEKLVAKK